MSWLWGAAANAAESSNAEELPERTQPEGSTASFISMPGGDITKLSKLPLKLSEPTVVLQRHVEAIRNWNLLASAANLEDLCERLAVVAAFSAAVFGGIEKRVNKPFPSCVGETYELETRDFLVVGEQIHPDVGVVQVDGKAADWSMHSTSAVRSSFHGTYLTVDPLDFAEVRLGDQWIRWKLPTCAANNVLVPGGMWLDYYGESVVEDVDNGLKCVLKYEIASLMNYNYSKQHQFAGVVLDATGKKRFLVKGNWAEFIDISNLETDTTNRVWELSDAGKISVDDWGRIPFSVAMLDGDPSLYPVTDVRRRRDIQALALRDYNAAREAREAEMARIGAAEKLAYKPQYFTKVGERYCLNGNYIKSGVIREIPR